MGLVQDNHRSLSRLKTHYVTVHYLGDLRRHLKGGGRQCRVCKFESTTVNGAVVHMGTQHGKVLAVAADEVRKQLEEFGVQEFMWKD